jgi:hypothetical protein
LACTVYPIVAAPWPLEAFTAIQPSWALADHVQSRSVFTATLPLPPDAGISPVLLVIDIAHLLGLGPLTVVVAEPPHAGMAIMSRRGHTCRRDGKRPAHMFVRTGQGAERLQSERREPLIRQTRVPAMTNPHRAVRN